VGPANTSGGTGLSASTAAGIGVGATLAGLTILGAVITWFVLMRRQGQKRGDTDLDGMGEGGEAAGVKGPLHIHELIGDMANEVDAEPIRSELPNTVSRV
jgi:hypothetical protein